MPAIITDPEIRAALRKIKTGSKTAITLTDAGPRGAGRLVLVVKPERAEWYARWFDDGKKRMEKLGSYPDLGLADARDKFRAPRVGDSGGSTGTTVSDLFAGYLSRLAAEGRPSVIQARRVLDHAAAVIGRDKPASEVTPADVVAVIKPIFARGARVQADKHRMYIGAAFRWGMKATYDYRVEVSTTWGITSNPIDAVPRDNEAEGVGNRWLSWEEYDQLMAWLLAGTNDRTPVDKALLLSMLTGQRITEILKLTPAHWNSTERLLTWETTKNGLPHILPVCDMAAGILDSLRPTAGGWFFPNESGQETHMPHGTARMRLKRYAVKYGIPSFTTRDLRRTWKTLSGQAGLTKEDRDRLQNHQGGSSDVSSIHYDRYGYLREKRAAVAKWQAWLEQQIRKARQ
jgi:integrase